MFRRIKEMIRDKILTIKVSHLYNTIGEDDILKKIGIEWTIAGKPLDPEVRRLLISEAQLFSRSRLWKELQKDIKYRANKKMFEESTSPMDMTMGKMWLYTIDTINTKVNNIAKEDRRNADARKS